MLLPPRTDEEIAPWVAGLGLPGIIDMHVHFLPDGMQRKVWDVFDRAGVEYGIHWPIRYRLPVAGRLALLRSFGVTTFAPLVYPHKPGMAAWLTEWVLDFAANTPGAVPTATIYPEPEVAGYLEDALRAGARCVKAHVQVGAYDPRTELLDKAWGMLAEAGVPVIVHCGHGPIPGKFTGLDVFEEVLRRHPHLVAVIAHAGMPDIDAAIDLVEQYPRVHLDTTMVGVDCTAGRAPLPPDWPVRLAGIADRVVLGTDFPSIPHPYLEQLAAIAGWAAADARLGAPFLRAVLHDTPARLLGLV
jgi:predicted TIM-barrel fold metal-dependent hydrolase